MVQKIKIQAIKRLHVAVLWLLIYYISLKFGLSEKHTKFEKNLPLGLDVYLDLVNVQTMRKIAQIFVCFSESPNFNRSTL
jgi:hypothetical protein